MRDLCKKYNLFTQGTKEQIKKLEIINKNTKGKNTLKDLAIAIYICSKDEYEIIFTILANELIKEYLNQKKA